METSIVGVGVGITDRFRSVVEEKAARIEHLAPRAQRVDIKVTHRAYHKGRIEDDTVELTLAGKGPVIRAEATDGDKFTALDLAVDKLCEQLRRAKDKRVDARNHPRGAKFEKGSGAIQGIDVQPASVDVLRAVATGEIPIVTGNEEEEGYTPVVIRTKEFHPEWMSVEEAADIRIEAGLIAAIEPHDEAASPAGDDVDGRARLALPSFSDVHVHLDSSRIGLPFRPHTGAPGVWGMMLNDRRNWRNTDVPHADIVAGTLERMIAKGTTRVRSYAQVDVDCRLEKFDSVMAAKEKFAA